MTSGRLSNKFLISISITLILFQYACSYFQRSSEETRLAVLLDRFHESQSGEILVASHRALHTKYPENSLAAINDAIVNGVDIIELDVRCTKDKKLILMHDSKIDRTTNGKGEVSDLYFDEIQKFELIRKDSSELSRKIPTLEEALLLAKNKILIDIDIKGAPVNLLNETILKTDTKNQIIFFDSEFEVLDSLLLIDSTFVIMPRARSFEDVIMIISKYNPKVIHIDDGFYTEATVKKIKGSYARIWINSLGKHDSIARTGNYDFAYSSLLSGGANIIQTDLPIELLNYLEENGFR